MVRRGKKGISPLIAAVLLIAFTMAVALALTAWITQFTKSKQEIAQEASEKTECIYKAIESRDEYAAWDDANKILRVYLVNVGSSPVTLQKIVVEKNGVPSLPAKFKGAENITLDKREEKFFYINLSAVKDPNSQIMDLSGGPDKVKIYTECEDVYDIMTKPVVGWNSFTYNGGSNLIQLVE